MTRYRKKPVEIEAMRLHAESNDTDLLDPNTTAHAEIAGWMLGNGFSDFHVHGNTRPFALAITTLEGEMIAQPGDWIIRGVKGEFYPCKPDIFAETYEPALTDEPAAADVATRKCHRCDGCGQIADSDEGESWSSWLALPLKSAAAVTLGLVKPIECPACHGSGKAAT